MINNIILALAGVMAAANIWFLICNSQTCRDRRWLVDAMFETPDWQVRRSLYGTVSYDRHLMHRFFLLDPWRLYPPRLMEGLKEARRGRPA